MSTQQAPPRAGLYLRMSKSKGGLKIDQQEALCREIAATQGYSVVKVYVDDGISAYSGADRPGWAVMLADIEAGVLDVLVAQAEDRFSRQPGEKATLELLSAAARVTWHTSLDGKTDPATSSGAHLSAIRAADARQESQRKSERQKQANDYRVALGMGRAGGPRPFGWNRDDRSTLHPVEAPALREAIEAVLRGDTVFSIVRNWNAQGILTTKYKTWQMSTVRQALVRPRNAGLILHRGEVVPDVTGNWVPVCSREEWDTVVSLLALKKSPYRGHEPKHLLTSIIFCRCGEPMRYALSGKNLKSYRCASTKTGMTHVNGPHTAIGIAQADSIVTEAVVSALLFAPSSQVPQQADTTSLGTLYARLSDLQASLGRLVDAVASGALQAADVASKRRELKEQEEAIQEQIDTISRENASAALLHDIKSTLIVDNKASFLAHAEAKDQIRDRFGALPLDQKRALIRALLDVVVMPGRTAERVSIQHKVADLNPDPQ